MPGPTATARGGFRRAPSARRDLVGRQGRRGRRRLLVLGRRVGEAALGDLVDDLHEEPQAHGRERPAPQGGGVVVRIDEAPLLRRDGAAVHGLREVVDAAAGDGIAALHGPLDRRDAPVPRQQRGVVADGGKAGLGPRLGGDERMRVRRDDDVDLARDVGPDDAPRPAEHRHGHAGGAGPDGELVVLGQPEDGDVVAFLGQQPERLRAEPARADEGDLHGALRLEVVAA